MKRLTHNYKRACYCAENQLLITRESTLVLEVLHLERPWSAFQVYNKRHRQTNVRPHMTSHPLIYYEIGNCIEVYYNPYLQKYINFKLAYI